VNWTRVPTENFPALIGGEYGITGFFDATPDGSSIWFGSSSSTESKRVFKSTNYGATWTATPININGPNRYGLTLKDANIGFIYGKVNGVFSLQKTTDGGNTFFNIPTSGLTGEVSKIKCVPNSNMIVARATTSGLSYCNHVLNETAITFQPFTNQINSATFEFKNFYTGYAGGTNSTASNGIYKFNNTISLIGSTIGTPWTTDVDFATTDGFNYKLSNYSFSNGEVKFRQNHAWMPAALDWGSTNFPSGVAVVGGPDIPIATGNYDVNFNIATSAFSFAPCVTNTTVVSACVTYTWPVNNTVYTTSGTYSVANGCSTEVLQLTINSNTIVTQPSNASICKQIGATASLSVVAGTTSATYQWQTQIATSTTAAWTVVPTNANYSGANSATLNVTRTTTTIPATGTKYKVVITGSCGNLTSTTAALQEQTVLSKAAVVTAKSSSNVALLPAGTTCNGSSVNLSLAAGSIGNIQWQSSTDGVSYTDLGSLVTQSALNAVNPILTTSSGVLTQNTWFRVVASNGVCSSVNGLAIKITVSAPAVAGTILGGDVTVCASAASAMDLSGTLVPFSNSTTLTLNGNQGTIVWQKSINYTATVPTWAAVAGATTSTLTVVNLTVDTWYRALVTSGACKATTDVTKITVSKVAKAGVVTATTNGAVTATVCSAGDITFTSAAYTGTSLQWEVSTTSTTTGFVAVAGETGLEFTMTNVAYAPLSKFYVRSVVTSGTCTIARSAVKTITVTPLSVAGTIKGGGTLCVNGGATVSVTGNTGMIQWQYSTDGITYMVAPYWKTVSGTPTYYNASTEFTTAASTGVAATYVFTNLNTSGSVYFRAKVTSGVCSETYTSSVEYVNGSVAEAGTISAVSTTLCPSTGTTLTLAGSLGAIQWQKATVSATTGLPGAFANIALQTGTTLATGNLTASAAYQAVVTIGSCSTVTASYVIITVVAKPVAKPITANPTTPSGVSVAAALCTSNSSKVLTIGAGSVGAIEWETSTTSTTSGFATIAGATGGNYTVTSASAGANYFRAKFTNTCGVSVYSAVVTVYYYDCAPAKVIETPSEVVKTPFSAVAYPNPFTASFNLSLTTSSTEKVSIMVYDMTGRQLEQREVPSNSMMEQQLGDSYPTGVYNVIVTQGKQVKTLRVIKR
jgi:hypothetical protein